MNRIIYVPQFPSSMRYQNWHITEFEKEFKKYFDTVIILGRKPKGIEKTEYGEIFSPINASIEYELQQIEEYLKLDVKIDDVLFLSDLSFPGFFANVLHHGKPKKCFAYVHATSKNRFDYFLPFRSSKWQVECGQAELFDKIFVGSEYHKKKLGWDNTEVVALPEPPFEFRQIKEMCNSNKIVDIFSASRPTPQKVNKEIEAIIEEKFSIIQRHTFDYWRDYYMYLAQSKVLISTSSEETFGYQIMDAILAGCIPIAPNDFSYPELLDREYLYDDVDELLDTLTIALNGGLPVPEKLLCQDLVDNFYKNICEIMKG
jgi:hypothetical protein